MVKDFYQKYFLSRGLQIPPKGFDLNALSNIEQVKVYKFVKDAIDKIDPEVYHNKIMNAILKSQSD